MSGVSVLTLARGRTAHLANLVEGLRRSERAPLELIVVDMNDAPIDRPRTPFPTRLLRLAGGALPLAAARNLAARAAAGRDLMFLDADCIPSRETLERVEATLAAQDGLACPEALYLGPADARGDWTEAGLAECGKPHAARRFPKTGVRIEPDAGLFWSLAFGVRKTTFEALGRFDEAFTGYGAEDTDLGYRAQAAGLPLAFLAGGAVFHQHHPISDPPIEHLADIVRNAELFRRKWGCWPMEGWLEAFEKMGAISIRGGSIAIHDRRRRGGGDERRRLRPAAG